MDLLENGEPVEEGARVANVAENRLDWSADDPAVLKAIDILSHCLALEYVPRRVLDQRGLLRKSRSAPTIRFAWRSTSRPSSTFRVRQYGRPLPSWWRRQ